MRIQHQEGMKHAKQLARQAAKEARLKARQPQQKQQPTEALSQWLDEHYLWDQNLFRRRNAQKAERRHRQKQRQSRMREWLRDHQNWDEALAPGSMANTHHQIHPINCTRTHCYWHETEKHMIGERLCRMYRYGFDFEKHRGQNAADNRWYNELRKHQDNHKATRGWPEGEDCPWQIDNCHWGWCDQQTEEELLERTVEKITQRNALDIGFQLAFETDPEKREDLKWQLEQQLGYRPKGQSHL